MIIDDIKQEDIKWLRKSLDIKAPSSTIGSATPMKQGITNLLNSPYKILAVLDGDKVSSVVSRTDIVKSVASTDQKKDPSELTIKDIANPDFVKVLDTDSIGRLIDVIVKNNLDHVVVVDNTGKFVGIVDRKKLAMELEQLVR